MKASRKALIVLVVVLVTTAVTGSVQDCRGAQSLHGPRLGLDVDIMQVTPELMMDFPLGNYMLRSRLGAPSYWTHASYSGLSIPLGTRFYSAPSSFSWGLFQQIRFGGGATISTNVVTKGAAKVSPITFSRLSASSVLQTKSILGSSVSSFLEGGIAYYSELSGVAFEVKVGITF